MKKLEKWRQIVEIVDDHVPVWLPFPVKHSGAKTITGSVSLLDFFFN